MIQQKKTDYESPTTAILELRSEGLICQSGNMTIPNWQDDGDPLIF